MWRIIFYKPISQITKQENKHTLYLRLGEGNRLLFLFSEPPKHPEELQLIITGTTGFLELLEATMFFTSLWHKSHCSISLNSP